MHGAGGAARWAASRRVDGGHGAGARTGDSNWSPPARIASSGTDSRPRRARGRRRRPRAPWGRGPSRLAQCGQVAPSPEPAQRPGRLRRAAIAEVSRRPPFDPAASPGPPSRPKSAATAPARRRSWSEVSPGSRRGSAGAPIWSSAQRTGRGHAAVHRGREQPAVPTRGARRPRLRAAAIRTSRSGSWSAAVSAVRPRPGRCHRGETPPRPAPAGAGPGHHLGAQWPRFPRARSTRRSGRGSARIARRGNGREVGQGLASLPRPAGWRLGVGIPKPMAMPLRPPPCPPGAAPEPRQAGPAQHRTPSMTSSRR